MRTQLSHVTKEEASYIILRSECASIHVQYKFVNMVSNTVSNMVFNSVRIPEYLHDGVLYASVGYAIEQRKTRHVPVRCRPNE